MMQFGGKNRVLSPRFQIRLNATQIIVTETVLRK